MFIIGKRGASSGLSGRARSTKSKRVFNLKRDDSENSKSVKDLLSRADTLMYLKKSNIVLFLSHEGEIGRAKNVDNMNIRNVAKNLGKRYDEGA